MKLIKDFGFKKNAIYNIVVKGRIEESWSENILGMQLSVDNSKKNLNFSSLIGEIRDQNALSGVLNTLCEMHMTVVAVHTSHM